MTSGVRPLPLSATGNDRSTFLQTAGNLAVVSATSAAQALQLAGDTFFAPAVTGQPSTTASNTFGRAATRNDRVAPPRFGNLADGLARRNGDDGARSELPPPAAKPAPSARGAVHRRASRVGPRCGRQGGDDEVANGRIKRRPAPTIESVRGRIGLHIPATLTTVAAERRRQQEHGDRGDGGAAHRCARRRPFHRVRPDRPRARPATSSVGSARAPRRPEPRRGRRVADLATDAAPSTHADRATWWCCRAPTPTSTSGRRRPSLAVGGRARVVVLTPHGVVHDDDVADTTVVIAAGDDHRSPSRPTATPTRSTDAQAGTTGAGSALDRVARRRRRGRTIVVDGRGPTTGWAGPPPLADHAGRPRSHPLHPHHPHARGRAHRRRRPATSTAPRST